MEILSTQNLSKNFGAEDVLKNINFSAEKGELISIIGRSGCGKTTFLRCLNCLNILNNGTINIDGIMLDAKEFNGQKLGDDHSSKSKNDDFLKDSLQYITKDEIHKKVHNIRKKVGFLFQNLNLFPHLTVIENVMLPIEKVLLKSYDEAYAISEKLLEKVAMNKYQDRSSALVSGGQAQRVAIARALAVNPQIMLYDEPTSALDPELVLEFIEIARSLKNEGMTQIIVTHSLGLAKTISDKVCYMDKGEIVEYGNPKDLFANPKKSRTKDYISKLILS